MNECMKKCMKNCAHTCQTEPVERPVNEGEMSQIIPPSRQMIRDSNPSGHSYSPQS